MLIKRRISDVYLRQTIKDQDRSRGYYKGKKYHLPRIEHLW